MSTKSIAPKPAPAKARPIDASDLEIALSKARAASALLKADGDYLDIPVALPRDTEETIRAWIQDFAFEALDAALEEAEAARQKIPGMRTAWPRPSAKRKATPRKCQAA